MRAEQRLREHVADANGGLIHFQHEGESVVRWVTGGDGPSIYATFHPGDDRQTVVCCPRCGQIFGHFDGSYGSTTFSQLSAIREVGSTHYCE